MLTVAQIQFSPELGNCSKNIKTIKSYLDSIDNVDLIILPELINTGYNFSCKEEAFELSNTRECVGYVDFLQDYSDSNNVHIVSGYMEKSGDELYNSSIFITPNAASGNYRKMHLFLNEQDIFKPGNLGLPTYDIKGYKFGMLICFDYLFTEIWRIMALKQVDFIVHPSNLITENAYITVPALALTNGYFIFTTNRTGTEGDITFCGRSFACDNRGKVIKMLDSETNGVLFSKIDPSESRNKMITPRNHILKDRRIDNYSDLLR